MGLKDKDTLNLLSLDAAAAKTLCPAALAPTTTHAISEKKRHGAFAKNIPRGIFG